MTRIFYLVPDHGRTGDESLARYMLRKIKRGMLPSGGVKVIYQHCELLKKNGVEVYPVHIRPFKVSYFPHSFKPLSLEKALEMSGEGDLFIVPEVIPYLGGKRKVLFAQNPGMIDPFLIPGDSYQDIGFEAVMTCGPYVTEAVRIREELPIFTVNNGIDLNVFKEDPSKREAKRVMWLGRRGRQYGERAASKFKDQAHFVELPPHLNEEEMVDQYQRADIVMLVGFPEGAPLPPMEAMACGAAVVGFTGGGGLQHMIDQKTALTAPDGDQAALNACLERILSDETLKEEIRRGGHAHIQEFGMERMERDLLAFVEAMKTPLTPTSRGEKKMTCAVGIATWQRPKLLQQCLSCLEKQTREPDQIIVDDSGEGLTRQRNKILEQVTSDIVVFLDDDAMAHPRFIENICRVWETGADLGCVQGSVVEGAMHPPSHKRPIGWERYLHMPLQEIIHRLRVRFVGPFFEEKLLQPVHEVPEELRLWPLTAVRTAYGCAMSFRRAPHFNELFESYAFLEDFEATYPIGTKKPIVVCHNASVLHKKETSGRIDPALVHATYLLNMAYIALKEMPGTEDHIRAHHKRYVRFELLLAPFRKKGFSQYRGAKRGYVASLELLSSPPELLDGAYKRLLTTL